MPFKPEPLPSSFMLMSMVGFIIFAVYTAYGKIDITWGFTLCLFFACVFIASMISLKASMEAERTSLRR